MKNKSIRFSIFSDKENREVNQAIENLNEMSKKRRSKNAILIFFVSGIILFWLTPNIGVFSFYGIGFFFFGMFLISLLAIPSYLLLEYLVNKLKRENQFKLGRYFWVVDTLYDVIMTYLLFRIFISIF